MVDYGDKASLTEALRGIHTILSFVQVLWDPEQQTQKNIIEAAIAAGVKRFAPSEFGRYKSTLKTAMRREREER